MRKSSNPRSEPEDGILGFASSSNAPRTEGIIFGGPFGERHLKRAREDEDRSRAIKEGEKYWLGGDYPLSFADHYRVLRKDADRGRIGSSRSPFKGSFAYYDDDAEDVLNRAKEHLLKSADSGTVGSDISYDEPLYEGQPGMDESRVELARAVESQIARREAFKGMVCTTRTGNQVYYGNLVNYLVITITVPLIEPASNRHQ